MKERADTIPYPPSAEVTPSRPANLLDRLINSSVDGILAFDRECRYTVWNPGMETISGVAAVETIGRCAFEVFPFLEEIGEDRFFHAALAGEQVVARDRPFVIPDTGRRGFFEGHYSPLLDEAGNVIGGLGIIRDVTARKRLEEELLHSQRLESLGRLAGGIAHDFNNLLTVIFGTVSVARARIQEGPRDEALDESLDVILTASQRAASLTGQLLAFARRQAVRPKVLDLNVLVTEVERLLRRLLGEDVEFHMHLDPGLWRAKVDPSQLEQVLVNLALNAREAMPSGGELHVETCNVTGQERPEGAGEFVRLVVRDTGVGLSEEVRRHVFDPFFTTKGSGRGLGLASCYGIVKQAGGCLTVDSEPGQGATFTIDLPRTLEPLESTEGKQDAGRLRGGETVLVVEDQATVRELLAWGFREHGYRVLEAADGGEALALVLAQDAPIQALVTDAIMPRMGGLELIARLREVRPEIRPLIMSGCVDSWADDLDDPDVPCIQKPFTPFEVVRKVRELLDGESSRRPAGSP